jgi:hypothetical protein
MPRCCNWHFRYHLQPDGTIAGGLTVREITELHQKPNGYRAGASRRIRANIGPKNTAQNSVSLAVGQAITAPKFPGREQASRKKRKP